MIRIDGGQSIKMIPILNFVIIVKMKNLILKHSGYLDKLASRYVWWNSPEWAYEHPDIFLSNVMNLGNWDDIQSLRQAVGDRVLKQVLRAAPAGYFHPRSWDYWHVKLGIKPIPALPKRKY